MCRYLSGKSDSWELNEHWVQGLAGYQRPPFCMTTFGLYIIILIILKLLLNNLLEFFSKICLSVKIGKLFRSFLCSSVKIGRVLIEINSSNYTYMENKRIKLTECGSKLYFVKTIKEVTGKSLLESKNIADSIAKPNGLDGYEFGTLLLNESSITPEQWEKIANLCPDVEYEYV